MKYSSQNRFLLVITLLLLTVMTSAETKLQNQVDPSTSEPNGEWIVYLNKDFLRITDADDCTYYRVINFKKGVIEGKAAYYYKSGKLFFEAGLLSVDPDVFKDGEVIYSNPVSFSKEIVQGSGKKSVKRVNT